MITDDYDDHLKVGQGNSARNGLLPAVPAFQWSPGIKVKFPAKKILLAKKTDFALQTNSTFHRKYTIC